MTITSAILVILSTVALFLYVQTRADRARRALSRLVAHEYWATRAFEAVRDIVAIEDFPVADLDVIETIVDRIDRPAAVRDLYAAFETPEATPGMPIAGKDADRYFSAHHRAEAAYLEFFYAAFMAISYLDGLGETVRPKIEALNGRSRDRARAMSDRLKTIVWADARPASI